MIKKNRSHYPFLKSNNVPAKTLIRVSLSRTVPAHMISFAPQLPCQHMSNFVSTTYRIHVRLLGYSLHGLPHTNVLWIASSTCMLHSLRAQSCVASILGSISTEVLALYTIIIKILLEALWARSYSTHVLAPFRILVWKLFGFFFC